MNPWLRILRHAWRDASDSRRVLPDAAAQRLSRLVAESERQHSGEIRVCVEAGLPLHCLWPLHRARNMGTTVRQRAHDWFGRLRVWDTEHNNGVLIYVLLAERAIEIVADRGITAHVGNGEWQTCVDTLRSAFQRQEYEQGLAEVIQRLSNTLAQHFPLHNGELNCNELPDTVVLC